MRLFLLRRRINLTAMAHLNRALLVAFFGMLLASALPACGSTEKSDSMRGGASGSAGFGQAGTAQGGGGSGKGGAEMVQGGSGGSVGGGASSGTSSGGAAGEDGAAGDGSSSNVSDLADRYCGAVRSCCQKAGFGGEQLADCESEYPEVYGLDW